MSLWLSIHQKMILKHHVVTLDIIIRHIYLSLESYHLQKKKEVTGKDAELIEWPSLLYFPDHFLQNFYLQINVLSFASVCWFNDYLNTIWQTINKKGKNWLTKAYNKSRLTMFDCSSIIMETLKQYLDFCLIWLAVWANLHELIQHTQIVWKQAC